MDTIILVETRNNRKFWELDSNEPQANENGRRRYMNYDHCIDLKRYPISPRECNIKSPMNEDKK